jgi:hypothetical protein
MSNDKWQRGQIKVEGRMENGELRMKSEELRVKR